MTSPQTDAAASRVTDNAISYGIENYDRDRQLRAILGGTWWQELSTAGIVKELERHERAQAHKLKTGHWTADRDRHIAVLQALAAERAELSRRDAA